MEAKDKAEKFQIELEELLKKYKAEITLEQYGKEFAKSERMVVSFDWDEKLGIIPDLVLGTYIGH